LLIAASELQGYIETRQSTLGEQAAEVLAEGGPETLKNWLLNEADIPPDTSIYVLDENSVDLLGRELPEQYSDFVKQSVIGKPVDPQSNYQPVRLAPQLIAPNGDRYAFLILPKGISVWGSPATMLSLLLVALLVIASVAWLIARALSNPISELQLAVSELAVGHTYARIPETISKRKDELGSLAANFNAMAEQLTKLIEGREQLMREMSHELRSPLARLHAAIALAAENGSLPIEEHDRVEHEIERMNRVIGELLRYSLIDTSITPKQKLVRVDKLLKELVIDEEIEAGSHNCKLKLEAETSLAVIGDPELLHSCFENILRNAIRYAPPDSVIDISAGIRNASEKSAGQVVVNISDQGPGVAVDQLEQIFEPYYRVARGAHHKDSTGLGLAIVKRITDQHAGEVSAIQREGGGLTVCVVLPSAELS
jgi:two-component system OmpR family sensor kinase